MLKKYGLHLLLIVPFCFCAASIYSQGSDSAWLTQALIRSSMKWEKFQTPHFSIFIDSGTAASKIDHIKNELENQRAGIRLFLDRKDFAGAANIIVTDTKEKIKKILGFEVQGFAMPEHRSVVFLHNDIYRLAAKHELTHYYAYLTWGAPADNWFSEGLAVFLDERWSGYPVDSVAKNIKSLGRMYPMSTLVKKFHSLNAMITYPQIGSFTGFLLGKYGKEKLKQLWAKGFKKTEDVFGKPLRVLEQEWLSFLDAMPSVDINYARFL